MFLSRIILFVTDVLAAIGCRFGKHQEPWHRTTMDGRQEWFCPRCKKTVGRPNGGQVG